LSLLHYITIVFTYILYSVDENNRPTSIPEVEAGLTQGIISSCMPMKQMRISLK